MDGKVRLSPSRRFSLLEPPQAKGSESLRPSVRGAGSCAAGVELALTQRGVEIETRDGADGAGSGEGLQPTSSVQCL